MAKRKIVLVVVVCLLMALVAGQALPQARDSNASAGLSDAERQRKMSDAERQREAAKNAKQLESERAQKMKDLAKEGRGPLIDRKQKQKEAQEEADEIRKGFLREKAALGVTEDQWSLIKPKLEKVRMLREQANSKVGLSLAGGSSDNETSPGTGARTNVPIWQWDGPWKDNPPGELTEAQKLAKQLIALVENKNSTPEQFRRTMDALRKARLKEAEIERQLVEAREELCEILTIRQQAALILMNSL